MFFKKNLHGMPVVKVKKASEIINSGSHKQKKYLSLMLVPSYTTGKTRTLRLPRSVFYFVLLALFVISAVIAGLQIRGTYFQHIAAEIQIDLELTQEAFDSFEDKTMQEIDDWIAQFHAVGGELSAEQIARQRDNFNMENAHQGELNNVQNQLNELIRSIRQMDESLLAAIEGLTSRTFVPIIGTLFDGLLASQAEIRAEFYDAQAVFFFNGYTNGLYAEPFSAEYADAGFITLDAGGPVHPARATEEDLLAQIEYAMRELDMLTLLKDDFVAHRALIAPHCRNHPTMWPIAGASAGQAPRISSPFGNRRDPFGSGVWQMHTGLDIHASTNTPIYASGGGIVTFSGYQLGGAGITVIIDHGNGYETMYSHNRRNTVSVGQRVERGEVIAFVGVTGRTTGAHLHFEIRKYGRAINPRSYLIEYVS
jgi:hypothetical protein